MFCRRKKTDNGVIKKKHMLIALRISNSLGCLIDHNWLSIGSENQIYLDSFLCYPTIM